MKRALLALLLAVAVAAPAHSAPARAVLVTPRANPGTDQNGFRRQLAEWQVVLDNLGIYHDVLSAENLPTAQALTGTYYYQNPLSFSGSTRQYDLVIIPVWQSTADNGRAGMNGDSLTLYAPWDGSSAQKPANASRAIHIFEAPCFGSGISGAAIFGPTVRCSTGVASWTYNGATENTAVPNAKTLYVPGRALRWQEGPGTQAGYRPVAVPIASGTPGILRPLLAMRTNVVGSDGAGASRHLSCDDCDSLVAGEGSFADTVVTWARYMHSSDDAPNIFTWGGPGAAQGQGYESMAAKLIPLALADSLLGYRLIGQEPGWQPIKLAMMFNGAFQRNVAGTGDVSLGQGRGISVHDSTRFKAVVRDSLAKLGIPITFVVQPDSVRAYYHEKAWYDGLAYPVKFMPISYTDAWVVAPNTTSRYVARDYFGYTHARALGFYGMTASDISGATYSDTCTVCLVKYAMARVDSIWPGRVCKAVYPRSSRLLPNAMNVKLQGAWTANLYSLNAALWWSGIRTVVTEIDNTEAAPNTSYSLDASSVPKSPSAAFYPLASGGYRRFDVYDDANHARQVGSLLYAPCQIISGEGGASNLNTVHNYANHFWTGVMFNRRARGDFAYYYHTFRSFAPVYRLDASLLHGTTGPGEWPRRAGWWFAKGVVNPSKAVNAFGRPVFKWVFVDEL